MSVSTHTFREGARDAMPIALGYLSVSFSFGLMAVSQGLSPFTAVMLSVLNLTSAGQVAGLSILVAGGGLMEMAMTQLIINLRYALMSLSLSQRLDERFSTPKRLIAAYGMTDEVFAVAASKKPPIGSHYFFGLEMDAFLGWTLGTLLGAVAGSLLPLAVTRTLGIAMYGMFIAIVVPPARLDWGVRVAAGIAVALSCAMTYVPFLARVSSGFAVILCAVAAAAVAACVKPVPEEDDI